MSRMRFKVHGLDCAEEVALIKGALRPLVDDTDQLQFDVLAGRLSVDGLDTTQSTQVQQAIAGVGLKAVPWERYIESSQNQKRRLDPRVVLSVVSGLSIVSGFTYHAMGEGVATAIASGELDHFAIPYPTAGLYLLSILTGAWFVLPKAWLALKGLRPDMNLLMVIAVMGALGLGNWQEGALVAFLFSVALLLESWSVSRARGAITQLMDLAPDEARVLATACGCAHPEGKMTAVGAVKPGAVILVKPGERIPLDGEVLEGESALNQAPITGESMPVPKGPGDTVFAGAINNDGALQITVTRDAEHSSLARIIHLVEEAQSRRAPTEQFVESFARYYTPVMVGAAVAIAVAAPLFFGAEWSASIYLACVVLLIACPCALVISTPVSIVAGIAKAARQGVLIKGGAFLEAPARIKALAIDKTGTLTRGAPELKAIHPLNGMSELEVLKIAARLEAHSAHPLAAAILQRAYAEDLEVRAAENHQTLSGRGASGVIDGTDYWIGNERLLRERSGEAASMPAPEADGAAHTRVVLGRGGEVVAVFDLADGAREQAADAVAALKRLGLLEVALLTGDTQATAEALARITGIESLQAELLPEDKVRAVEDLRKKYGAVAMVGDGINDAPALAAADVSIAMGTAGSDAAIDAADIALMSSDLSKLPWLIGHSRHTLRIIQQNVAISLGLKAVVFGLALFGFASLWLAIAADMGASLLVIANALRLLR